MFQKRKEEKKKSRDAGAFLPLWLCAHLFLKSREMNTSWTAGMFWQNNNNKSEVMQGGEGGGACVGEKSETGVKFCNFQNKRDPKRNLSLSCRAIHWLLFLTVSESMVNWSQVRRNIYPSIVLKYQKTCSLPEWISGIIYDTVFEGKQGFTWRIRLRADFTPNTQQNWAHWGKCKCLTETQEELWRFNSSLRQDLFCEEFAWISCIGDGSLPRINTALEWAFSISLG